MISKDIDKVLAAGLTPSLRSLGYKKSAHTWRRPVGDVLQVVNIQLSMTNRAGSGSFTMNLGVYVPEIPRLFGDDPLASPKEYECPVRQRIGRLMPANGDHWWEVGCSVDLDALGRQVADAFTSYGIPWLEKRASLAGLRAHFEGEDKGSLEGCALALLCGDRGAARLELELAMRESSRSATLFLARCRMFAERNKLLHA